jgi:outer membrane lipoprotein-sorting protein
MPVTRRALIVALAVSPLAAAPAAAQAPTDPAAKLQKAYSDVRENSARLTQISVPMNLEPAAVFKP